MVKKKTIRDKGCKFDSKSKACKTPYYLRVAGKGDNPRPTNKEKFDKNWNKIRWGRK